MAAMDADLSRCFHAPPTAEDSQAKEGKNEVTHYDKISPINNMFGENSKNTVPEI